MRRFVVPAAAIAALALCGCHPAGADASFDARVKTYLMSHPEELRAALENMQAKEDEAAEKEQAAADVKARAALPALRAALERDPRDFVANPAGKVTVTEFYDYNCEHCINIAPKVVALIRNHPDVRFVFKEFPIFGPVSDHAARVALAAKAQGKDYVGLYEALMATHPLDDATVNQIAKAKGVDLTAANAPTTVATDEEQLAATASLAKKLAIDGTPGFVVGDELIHGEDYDGLTAAIEKAGAKG
jgi:protein-disulfide isomerase